MSIKPVVACDVFYMEQEVNRERADGIMTRCTTCGAEEEAVGCNPASIRLCLSKLRKNCERSDERQYVCEDIIS